MNIKKYIPNSSSLKHYAGTNIVVNLLVLLNYGFWTGVACAIILQIVVETNQFLQSKMGFEEYIAVNGIDTIWDTLFAILGILTPMISVTKWI